MRFQDTNSRSRDPDSTRQPSIGFVEVPGVHCASHPCLFPRYPTTMSQYVFKSEDIATGSPGYVAPLSVAFSPDGIRNAMSAMYRILLTIVPILSSQRSTLPTSFQTMVDRAVCLLLT